MIWTPRARLPAHTRCCSVPSVAKPKTSLSPFVFVPLALERWTAPRVRQTQFGALKESKEQRDQMKICPDAKSAQQAEDKDKDKDEAGRILNVW